MEIDNKKWLKFPKLAIYTRKEKKKAEEMEQAWPATEQPKVAKLEKRKKMTRLRRRHLFRSVSLEKPAAGTSCEAACYDK